MARRAPSPSWMLQLQIFWCCFGDASPCWIFNQLQNTYSIGQASFFLQCAVAATQSPETLVTCSEELTPRPVVLHAYTRGYQQQLWFAACITPGPITFLVVQLRSSNTITRSHISMKSMVKSETRSRNVNSIQQVARSRTPHLILSNPKISYCGVEWHTT